MTRRLDLEREIASVCRKVARQVASGELKIRNGTRKYVEALAETLGLDLMEMAVEADMLPERARRPRPKLEAYAVSDPARDVIAMMDEMDHDGRAALRDYARFLTETRRGR